MSSEPTHIKYKAIKSMAQYLKYCKMLEKLTFAKTQSRSVKDEIELLTILIERWDQDHNIFELTDPIKMLRTMMKERKITPKDLGKILNVSSNKVVDILDYRKRLSKAMAKKLAEHFKVSQEGLNRYYKLDDIGFIGTQQFRSKAQVTKDAVRTSKAIKAAKVLRAQQAKNSE